MVGLGPCEEGFEVTYCFTRLTPMQEEFPRMPF